MVRLSPETQPATALVEVDPLTKQHATCPLCHTTDTSLTDDELAGGRGWRCIRCGQHWDARRLATVAAYAASELER